MSVPDLLARILVEPGLLAALERRDFAVLRRDLAADPAQVEAIAAIDTGALRFYRRRLQRKRLEMMENIFVATLPAARNAFGPDELAARFWDWYQPGAAIPAPAVIGALALEWTRFAADLAGRSQLDWIGELSRYELMRWNAQLARAGRAAPPPGSSPALSPRGQREAGHPVLAPGTGADSFSVDVPLLLRTALAGNPVVASRNTRLITWCAPAGDLKTAEIGIAILQAVLACDGRRTIAQIATAAGAGRPEAEQRIAATLADLVRAGALRMSAAADLPAEQQHPAGVQPGDGAKESGQPIRVDP